MNNIVVTVVPDDKIIIVNGEPLIFDFSLIECHKNMHALQYGGMSSHIEFKNCANQPLSDLQYEEQVAPYVAAWEEEKARLEAEAAAAEAEYNSFENVRARKLEELSMGLDDARADNSISIKSKVGFAINASDTSMSNVQGLISVLELSGGENTNFMAFDNTLHQVTLQDLKTMQVELAIWGQALYAYKWTVRNAIETAKTVEEINSIEIDYSQAASFYAGI